MSFTPINNNSFEKEVLQSEHLTIVIFFANWAGSCQILYNTLNEIIKENKYKNIIKITEVDIDNNIQLTRKLNIKSIPTILFYKNAEFLDATYGALPKTLIIEKINRYAL